MNELNYCKNCGKQGTWKRNFIGDWRDIDGKVVEFCYRCSHCGNTTIRPVDVEVRK
jgi:hypothetical protein